MVQTLLSNLNIKSDLMPLVTTGDRMQKGLLSEITVPSTHETGHLNTGKGLFIKEIQEALLQGQAHIAVHSMKDLPVTQTQKLSIVALLPRATPNDVLVLSPNTIKKIGSISSSYSDLVTKLGSAAFSCDKPIGTTSRRRQLLMQHHFGQNLSLEILRGNVDTRLARVRKNDFDAILLAQAGLERLGLFDTCDMISLPVKHFVPAAAQGIIAVEVVSNDSFLKEKVHMLNCFETCLQAGLERLILFLLEGDCQSPVGAYFSLHEKVLFCVWEKSGRMVSKHIQIEHDQWLAIESMYHNAKGYFSDFFRALTSHQIAKTWKGYLDS